MDIKAALASLDPLDDSHWTADGAPRLDVVSARAGGTVTRQQVRAVAPEFSRERSELSAFPAAVAPAAPPAPQGEEGAEQGEQQDEEQAAPELTTAELRAQELDQKIAKLRATRDAIDKELGELAREQAILQPKLDALADRNADQKARMEFIAAQDRQRRARAGVVEAAGVATAAPLDRSFARRGGFGGKRPNYPPMNRQPTE